VHLGLHAGGAEQPDVMGAGHRAGLLQQRRFADARFASDD
jgi:hypothetical protein